MLETKVLGHGTGRGAWKALRMIDLSKLRDSLDWIQARKEIESSVLKVLGVLPKERAELQIKVVDEDSFPGYTRRRVNYFVSDWERIAAWLFVPNRKEPVPGIVCCHSEHPEGKSEPAGLAGERLMALAVHYAEQGYATLAPDCATAGERVSGGKAAYDTSNFYKDWPKGSLLGKMVWDYTCGLYALGDVPGVDSSRLGIIGHGLGGTCALLVAALDERVQVCVASCGFTRFHDDKEVERWVEDGHCALAPNLKDAIAKKEFPFDWEHVLALAAPTPTLLITALNDAKLLNTKSCQKAKDAAGHIYRMLGRDDALEHYTHSDGRTLTVDALDAADSWFERWL